MKRITAALVALLLALVLGGCTPSQADVPVPSTPPATTVPPETAPQLPTKAGWYTIDGGRYCISPQGTPHTGWLTDGNQRFYLNQFGRALTGWQELDGKRYYFREDGAMAVGWTQLAGNRYFFGMDGSLITGFMTIDGKGYYFTPSGEPHTGWLTLANHTYYFDALGVMAVGEQVIEGRTYHFTPQGIRVLLVNPANPLPSDYAPDLTEVPQNYQMDISCASSLLEMLTDCEAAGYSPWIVSGYRTQGQQEYLYERKVQYYLDLELSQEEAEREAAKSVAVPGTSEHQLGLAVDILDAVYTNMDEKQAQTGTQQWLMEHCHEYGFILRYPNGTTDITGIIFEPWHYRYVGVDIAREITNLGITLEEYLGAAPAGN